MVGCDNKAFVLEFEEACNAAEEAAIVCVIRSEAKEEAQLRKNATAFHNKMNSRKSLLKSKNPVSIIKMRVFSHKAK